LSRKPDATLYIDQTEYILFETLFRVSSGTIVYKQPSENSRHTCTQVTFAVVMCYA